MKLTIDNLGGAGAVDYSAALCMTGPLKIARTLNAPSICSSMLDVSDTSLAVPVRRGRVVVTAASGTVLFTGYVATEPEAVFWTLFFPILLATGLGIAFRNRAPDVINVAVVDRGARSAVHAAPLAFLSRRCGRVRGK